MDDERQRLSIVAGHGCTALPQPRSSRMPMACLRGGLPRSANKPAPQNSSGENTWTTPWCAQILARITSDQHEHRQNVALLFRANTHPTPTKSIDLNYLPQRKVLKIGQT
jgi:hypothetical protein